MDQIPSDLISCLRRLGSAILTQDASIRALLALVERGLIEDERSHDRLERLLRNVEQAQFEIRECLRITQSDVSDVKENTGKHALIRADEDLSIRISGRAKISDIAKSGFQLLWRFKLLWAAGGGAAVIKAIEKVLPMIGGHS